MRPRDWVRYQAEYLVWKIGTAMREWACISAGGEHDYIGEDPRCIVCGHETPPASEVRE